MECYRQTQAAQKRHKRDTNVKHYNLHINTSDSCRVSTQSIQEQAAARAYTYLLAEQRSACEHMFRIFACLRDAEMLYSLAR